MDTTRVVGVCFLSSIHAMCGVSISYPHKHIWIKLTEGTLVVTDV